MAKKSMKKMDVGGTAPKPGTSAQISAFLKDPRSFSVMKKGGSVGKTPMTPAQKKFAALAAPKNKITFADKIAGSKKK